jgi:3-methyladenine DNA glycosylase/8-oxoguanine DNA glycosylase
MHRPDASDRFRPPHLVDLRRTLGPSLRFPTGVVRPDGLWRATRTPEGTATVRLRSTSGGAIDVQAWGDGSRWAVSHAPEIVGANDEADGFSPLGHPVVRDLIARFPGLRIPRTRAVFEQLTIAVLEQKVQGRQARRSYRAICARWGSPAPGPGAALGLRVAPAPPELARVPAWAFHECNVERKRAVTLAAAARYADRLEECVDLPPLAAAARMTTLPGIGAWTAAEVAVVALGDADAVSVGDFHLPNTVSHALAADVRADDSRMLELLEPWRGQRGRVVKLIEAAGIRAPKFGPRLALHDIRGL